MSKPKYDHFVAVFFDYCHYDGPDVYTRFVTKLEDNDTARWESGKPAMVFSESYAKDIVYGLTFNGYTAGVVKVFHGVTLTNPPEKG